MGPGTSISLLGSGWLGLPLAQQLLSCGCRIKASTRSLSRSAELRAVGAEACIVDIDRPGDGLQELLDADVLVINITSKSIDGFAGLVREIEASRVGRVLFVSSTSVYSNSNDEVSEDDGAESADSPLYAIENLLRRSGAFATTVVRFAGLVGPGRHPGRFFRGGRQVRYPDAPVNLIHLDDCIGILMAIIEQDAWGEVFSACADTHPSKREFYTAAALSIDADLPQFIESDSLSYKIVGNDKVKRVLGYSFSYPDVMAMLEAGGALR